MARSDPQADLERGSVSHPPEYPGRQRLKRAAAAAGSDAYQGAFEAIGAVLVGGGFGYWADWAWDSSPWGLLVGIALGFAAMVLRLLRLGKELDLDQGPVAPGVTGPDAADDLGLGEAPGLSDLLRSDDAEGGKEGHAALGGNDVNAKNKKIDGR